MKKVILIVLSSLFILSCSSGPYIPQSDPHSPEASGKKVVLFDENLVDRVAVDRAVVTKRNEQDCLVVQAALRNQTDKPLSVQVQVLFKDAQGVILYSDLGAETPWQSMVLSPNETKSISQVSLTSSARDYTVRVRSMNQKLK